MARSRILGGIPLYGGAQGQDVEEAEPVVELDASTKLARAQYDRARQSRDMATQAAALAGDPVASLRHATRQSGLALMSGLRRSGITKADMTAPQQRNALNAWQRTYTAMMVMDCVGPLRNGMRPETLLETVGMSTAMWLLSPNFRQIVGENLHGVHQAITNRIATFGAGQARSEEERVLLAGGSRQDLSAKLIRRLERAERVERHGLDPMTAQSAAMAEIGIAENAYLEMRAPGADPARVKAAHGTALDELYAMADRDGVKSFDVSTAMRQIVSARMSSEPELGRVFKGLGHGQFVRGETGTFFDVETGAQVDRGSFLVRPPMGVDEHRAAMTKVFDAELETAAERGPEALNATLLLFRIGSGAGDHPEVVNNLIDLSSRRPLTQARMMFDSMIDDGVSTDTAEGIYNDTFTRSVISLATGSPQLFGQWYARYGEEFEATVQGARETFDDLGEHLQATAPTGMEEPIGLVPGSSLEQVSEVYDAELVDEDNPTPGAPRPADEREIVDAEVLSSDLPAAGAFVAPKYGTVDQTGRERLLLDRISHFMGSDILRTAHVDRGVSPDGNSGMPRRVYSSSSRSLRRDPVRQNAPFSASAMLWPRAQHQAWYHDQEANDRAYSMVTMQQEMVRLGMPAAAQDKMFAAAYVRGLEKAVLADPSYERVLQRAAGSSTSVAWQELEFARAVAGSHTGPSVGGYQEYLTGYGMDPEVLHQMADEHEVTFGQLHEAQATFEDSLPDERDIPSTTVEADMEARRLRQVVLNQQSRRINQEYNAEGNDAQILDPDADFTRHIGQ